MNYKYKLQPYSGRNSRYTCPRCKKPYEFILYVDAETNQPLAAHVGFRLREVRTLRKMRRTHHRCVIILWATKPRRNVYTHRDRGSNSFAPFKTQSLP